MTSWHYMPGAFPNDDEEVWLDRGYWYGPKFKGTWKPGNAWFSTTDGGQPIYWFMVHRWKHIVEP